MGHPSRKVFISGATGMAGTSLVRHCLDHWPDATIRGTYFQNPPFIKDGRAEFIQADLTRRKDCLKAVRGCDYAIMAAAHTGGAGSTQGDPSFQTTDNLVMDALLLEALHLEGIRRVLYVSSAVVYQDHDGFIHENELDWNQDPHRSYLGVGWAKRSAEKLCRFWHVQYGMEIVIVRASNIYGPHSKFDPEQSNFIPAVIRKAVDRLDPFEVWGSRDVARDVLYVEDFSRAVLLLLRNPKIKFDVFNLGSGALTTVSKVVELALNCASHKPKAIRYDTGKPSTIQVRALNCDKIQKTIDWKPSIGIKDGIKLTTQWWIDNRNWWKR